MGERGWGGGLSDPVLIAQNGQSMQKKPGMGKGGRRPADSSPESWGSGLRSGNEGRDILGDIPVVNRPVRF